MGDFVSGAINRPLFASVTQNLFGFDSAATVAAGGGVPMQVVINGLTYTRLASRTTGQLLSSRTTGQPLYGRAA